MQTLEGKIVQHADRLNALGAIRIARAFAYRGHKQREPYKLYRLPTMLATFDAYKKVVGQKINHFYKKLYLLKNL